LIAEEEEEEEEGLFRYIPVQGRTHNFFTRSG
jgi:hypothetical protein